MVPGPALPISGFPTVQGPTDGAMETLLEDPMTVEHSAPPRALIADDQPAVLDALRLLLKQHGYEVETAGSPAALIRSLELRVFDLLLMDLNYTRDTTSGQEGLDLLSRIRALDHTLPVVAMTAWGSVELAVEAMHRGVGDFVLKPWDNDRLLAILRAQIEQGRTRRRARQLESEEKSELLEAREIQRGLLPREIPQLAGYEIAGAWQPAHLVGGDYFDVFELGASRAALCIADVAGKGMPAALLMSNLQAMVRGSAFAALEPQALCARVNSIIRANTGSEKFVTLFYARLDGPAKKLVYANGGHNAPVLVHADGSHGRLSDGGPLLGVFPEWNYGQSDVELSSGDRLVLFTDGVTEAANSEDEEFGEERLIGLVVEHRRLGAKNLQSKILEVVAAFSDGPFRDDATLIVVAVK